MKRIKYLMIPALILTIGVGFNSCTDDFEEINTDPLSLTADKVDASLIGLAFAQTQYNTLNGVHWRFQISQNL
ncbi:MAG: SusD/RagB family nutrient-binding outer membrane lipoprotein, partial [Cyclobacteriaceae bacterium]|nr:SusD/RagB family nutrient-binding outer membrane lipoprotein [Cyclobacteriaceae bacterium]